MSVININDIQYTGITYAQYLNMLREISKKEQKKLRKEKLEKISIINK